MGGGTLHLDFHEFPNTLQTSTLVLLKFLTVFLKKDIHLNGSKMRHRGSHDAKTLALLDTIRFHVIAAEVVGELEVRRAPPVRKLLSVVRRPLPRHGIQLG